MFGDNKTYFAGSPVVITIGGLEFPPNSAIKVVRVEVIYDSKTVGSFSADVGNSTSIDFDISSALRAIWGNYEYVSELESAQYAADADFNTSVQEVTRLMREYSLTVYTEYIADDGVFTQTSFGPFTGGRCILGGMNEMERYEAENPDVSALEHTNPRNGDASTKPTSSPEMVGSNSITSWVDVNASGTKSIFYPNETATEPDDTPGSTYGWNGHAPIVLRDSVAYTDFLFVNRRGAVETCSAQMLESMNLSIEAKNYARVGKPSFKPSRSIMAIATGGRRSWSMSSGYQTREWAEWWAMEFLMAKRWWMLYDGKFIPVTVEPTKKATGIYDRTKQQMSSVEFTVTLAFEG